MGDYFHTIVVKDVSPESVDEVANIVLDWLVERGIVKKIVHTFAHGSTDFWPGPACLDAISDEEKTVDFQDLVNNELEVKKGRQAFWGWLWVGGLALNCPNCGSVEHTLMDPIIENFHNLLSEWENGSETTILECPGCQTVRYLQDWDYGDTVALGNLGFTFWNWPNFDLAFLDEFSQVSGFPLRVVSGKV